MQSKFNFELQKIIEENGTNALGIARLFAAEVKNRLVFAEDAKKFYFNDGKKWQLDFSQIYHEKEIVDFTTYLLDMLKEKTENEATEEENKKNLSLMCLVLCKA